MIDYKNTIGGPSIKGTSINKGTDINSEYKPDIYSINKRKQYSKSLSKPKNCNINQWIYKNRHYYDNESCPNILNNNDTCSIRCLGGDTIDITCKNGTINKKDHCFTCDIDEWIKSNHHILKNNCSKSITEEITCDALCKYNGEKIQLACKKGKIETNGTCIKGRSTRSRDELLNSHDMNNNDDDDNDDDDNDDDDNDDDDEKTKVNQDPLDIITSSSSLDILKSFGISPAQV